MFGFNQSAWSVLKNRVYSWHAKGYNQVYPGYSNWKQRLRPWLLVMGACVSLAWWRPGHNHNHHTRRVDSFISTHSKVGLTQHFDPEKHMSTHWCKRMWGNTTFPLLRVQENQLCKPTHTHIHTWPACPQTHCSAHVAVYTWKAVQWLCTHWRTCVPVTFQWNYLCL